MTNISNKAEVSPKAKIGERVTIYPFVYIEDDVEIGDDSIIFLSSLYTPVRALVSAIKSITVR